jgi:hypothetical protein
VRQSLRHVPPLSFLFVTLLSVASSVLPAPVAPPAVAPVAPGVAGEAKPPASDGTIVHVRVQTVVIDRGGTTTKGEDEADLAPGATGVLRKEVTLVGRDRRRTKEPVIVEARLTPTASPPAGAACELRVALTTRPGGKTAKAATLDTRQALVPLAAGEERLVEAYASTVTGGRVALRVSCAQARAAAGEIPDLVTLDLSIERTADDEPAELLRSQRLVAALGREVSTVVVANRTLPDGPEEEKRYRRERIEAVLSPVITAAGSLQLDVRISGDVTTMSAENAPSFLPFERAETFVVIPGERRRIDIPMAAREPDEGWTRLTLVIEITARF